MEILRSTILRHKNHGLLDIKLENDQFEELYKRFRDFLTNMVELMLTHGKMRKDATIDVENIYDLQL